MKNFKKFALSREDQKSVKGGAGIPRSFEVTCSKLCGDGRTVSVTCDGECSSTSSGVSCNGTPTKC